MKFGLPSKLLFAAAMALAASHTAAWLWLSGTMEAGFTLAMDERRAAGWIVSHGPPTRSGWPLHVELQVPAIAMSVEPGEYPVGLAWATERLTLRWYALHPRELLLQAEGPQTLRFGELPPVGFITSRSVLAIPLDPAAPPSGAELQIDDLRVTSQAAPAGVARLRLRVGTPPAATPDAPAFHVTALATGVLLPQGPRWVLGPAISSLSLQGTVSGPWPPQRGLSTRTVLWRDGGGKVEIQDLALIWGTLDLTAGASLMLDEAMQPAGSATAQLAGQAETLDALAAGRLISTGTASAAKVLLALMSRVPAGGGAPVVEVPLTLRGRVLTMGQISLARLPELVWPSDP